MEIDWITYAVVFTLSGVILIWLKKKVIRKLNKEKSPANTYDEVLIKKVYNQITMLVMEEKIYLNKNLKVLDIALKLNCSEKLISRAINMYSNGNFNTFINSFRVDYAKDLLSGGKFDHYTIEAIALESGFSNKVSFYNAFKSFTGMSPKQFKASKQP